MYRKELPYLYLVALAQPRVPWSGNDAPTYKQTLLRPDEKWAYARDATLRRLPAVMEHADLDKVHARPPEDKIVGDTLGAWHDSVGNVFQVLRLPTSKTSTADVHRDLARGERWGVSLFTNLGRDRTTHDVEKISVPHIGLTKDPAWGRVGEDPFEEGPAEYDKGSWVRYWTQDPRELQRHLQSTYGSDCLARVPREIKDRLAEEASAYSEPPPLVSSIDWSATMATAAGAPASSDFFPSLQLLSANVC